MDTRKWSPAAALREQDRSLTFKLLRARELVMQRFRPHLRSHDLTEQQWRVLRVLAESGPLSMLQLSQRSLLLPPSLSRTVPKLEQRGLLARRVDGADQRRARVFLNDAGRRLFAKVADGSEAIYADLGAILGSRMIEQVYDVLDAMIERLAADDPAAGAAGDLDDDG